jgi:hypothetical protein
MRTFPTLVTVYHLGGDIQYFCHYLFIRIQITIIYPQGVYSTVNIRKRGLLGAIPQAAFLT